MPTLPSLHFAMGYVPPSRVTRGLEAFKHFASWKRVRWLFRGLWLEIFTIQEAVPMSHFCRKPKAGRDHSSISTPFLITLGNFGVLSCPKSLSSPEPVTQIPT